jgi:hypothetical protein
MDKKTKMLLGLGAVAVALYFVFKPKGSKGQKTCAENEFLVQVQCDKAPCPTICTKGTYAYGYQSPQISDDEKEKLFGSTIVMQSGYYQVTPEWLKEEIAAERKAIQDKIDALGLRKEYELWLKNYNKLHENAPNPQ